MEACRRCGTVLEPDRVRHIDPRIVWLASFALAFGHGGLWAHELLSRPFCPRCRTRVTAMALAGASAIFLIAIAGATLLLLFVTRSNALIGV